MSTKPILGTIAATALIAGAFSTPAEAQSKQRVAKFWERPSSVNLTIRGDARAAAAARAQALREYEAQLAAAQQPVIIAEETLPQDTTNAAQAPVYDPANDPAWWVTPQTYAVPGTNTQILSAPIQNFAQPLILGAPVYGGYGGAPAYGGFGYGGFNGFGVPSGVTTIGGFPGYPATSGFGVPVYGGFGFGVPTFVPGNPYSGFVGGVRLGF